MRYLDEQPLNSHLLLTLLQAAVGALVALQGGQALLHLPLQVAQTRHPLLHLAAVLALLQL